MLLIALRPVVLLARRRRRVWISHSAGPCRVRLAGGRIQTPAAVVTFMLFAVQAVCWVRQGGDFHARPGCC